MDFVSGSRMESNKISLLPMLIFLGHSISPCVLDTLVRNKEALDPKGFVGNPYYIL